MGRFIDPNKPLTPADRAFLKEWSLLHLIEANDAKFADLTTEERRALITRVDADNEHDNRVVEEEEIPFAPEVIAQVQQLTTPQIRDGLRKRHISDDGDPDEVEERLLNILQDEFEEATEA